MKESLDIQFVSDIMCPWCVVGLGNLNKALDELKDTVSADITFQPFELNPEMRPEGQDFSEHITEKYGITKAQSDENRVMIQARGKEVDFDFNFHTGKPYAAILSTRIAYCIGANLEGKQAELKMALF